MTSWHEPAIILGVVDVAAIAVLGFLLARSRARAATEIWKLKESLRYLGIDVEPKCQLCWCKFQPYGSCVEHPAGCKYFHESGTWCCIGEGCQLPHVPGKLGG